MSTSGSGQQKQSGTREQFTLEECAVVLSHFDIGAIESVQEYARGSRKAPKLLIASEQGRFLLKRRARGRDDPFKGCLYPRHPIASGQQAVPAAAPDRDEEREQLGVPVAGRVYELFEYIPGQAFSHTAEASFDGGHTLALFHKLLSDFTTHYQPPTGSYHAAVVIEQGLQMLQNNLLSAGGKDLRELGEYLVVSYTEAAKAVDAEGLPRWPRRICHADWHPGNMLYRDNRIVAVIDYDSSRLLAPVIDVANGALQFSVIYGEEDIDTWPANIDEARYRQFLAGYEEVTILSEAEIPHHPVADD